MANKQKVKQQIGKGLRSLIDKVAQRHEVGLGQVPDVLMQPSAAMPVAKQTKPAVAKAATKPTFNPFDLTALEREDDQAAKLTLSTKQEVPAGRQAFIAEIENRLEALRAEQARRNIPKQKLAEVETQLSAQTLPESRVKALDLRSIAKPLPSNTPTVKGVYAEAAKKAAPKQKPSSISADLEALARLRARQAAGQPAVPAVPAQAKAEAKAEAAKPANTAKSTKAAKPKAAKKPTVANTQAPTVERSEVEAFLDTPSDVLLEAKAQADLAGFFMDEFQLVGFKHRIEQERSQQTQLKPCYFNSEQHQFAFDKQAQRADISHPVSALFNEQDMDEWVESLVQAQPPLYKVHSQVEAIELSPRTQEALKVLPLIGRNVTMGSLLNSWDLMDKMQRPHSLVLQPDFVRLDPQQTQEHELFLGQSNLLAHRNHTLFKPTDSQGYLTGTAIHLVRPRHLLAAHEDLQSFTDRLHPLQKRTLKQPAFDGWFNTVHTKAFSQITLIESFVAEITQRYQHLQGKLLKQAKALANVLMAELKGSETDIRNDVSFQMRFFQQHGFVPSSSFYDFMELPVKGVAGAEQGLPLWQAMGKGLNVKWENIQLEEQPLDLMLLHFLALYAENPAQSRALVKPMAMLDLLLRCGNLFEDQPNDTNAEEKRQSMGVLRAYEHLLREEENRRVPATSHHLGHHYIAWDRDTQKTPACGVGLNHEERNSVADQFSGLKGQLQAQGLWREDIAKCARLLGMQYGLTHQ